ncbi:MAG TPA: LPXTG cell wall anchor domain-containing protein, partial [Ignavibacteriaceae bacterium]|nr:LPXTG cell wall anchor domain-containing protein [Ignavibacteriaceae bacterium]
LEWMPYLLNSKLLTTAQKDEIEKKISEWKAAITPKDNMWLYAVIGLAVLFVVALFFILRKKNVTPEDPAKM